MTINTKLTTLAFAASSFVLLAAGNASAIPLKGLGHGPAIPPGGFHLPSNSNSNGNNGGGKVVSCHPGTGCTVTPPFRDPGYGRGPSKGSGGEVVSCHPGTGCTVTGGDRDRGHDGDHDGYGDHDHDHDRGWGHDRNYWRSTYRDYDRYYWDRWHGWRLRPEFLIEGGPVAVPGPVAAPVAAPAPVEAAPARIPAAAPVAPPVAQAPCNCLTKQTLADGSVLFQDICTKESAIAAPQVGAR